MKGQEKGWGQGEVLEVRSNDWRYGAGVGDRKGELDEKRIKYRYYGAEIIWRKCFI